MPTLKFSKLVWLVLLSQFLSLAVVSSVLWEFQKGVSQVSVDVGSVANQPRSDNTTGSSTGDPNLQRPTIRPPKVRVIGKPNSMLECMVYALGANRQYADRESEVGSAPNPGEESGKKDGLPGDK